MTTSNVDDFLDAIKSIDSTFGGHDEDESSLTALLYTATEPKINWTLGSTPHTNKVVKLIAIATDAYYKSHDNIPENAGPEYNYPVPNGYADCTYGPPKLRTLFDLLRKEKIYLIRFIYGYYTSNDWDKEFDKNTYHGWSSNSEGDEKAIKTLGEGIDAHAHFICNP